jgi:hypothetical protein
MTIENDVLREDLRAWMKSPAIGLPEYSADLQIQRRVGRMIANCGTSDLSHAQRQLMVNWTQPRVPEEPQPSSRFRPQIAKYRSAPASIAVFK